MFLLFTLSYLCTNVFSENLKKKHERASQLFGSCDPLLNQVLSAAEDGQVRLAFPSVGFYGLLLTRMADNGNDMLYIMHHFPVFYERFFFFLVYFKACACTVTGFIDHRF